MPTTGFYIVNLGSFNLWEHYCFLYFYNSLAKFLTSQPIIFALTWELFINYTLKYHVNLVLVYLQVFELYDNLRKYNINDIRINSFC